MKPASSLPQFSTPLRIGFLLSGGGRTLENLHNYLSDKPQIGKIACVISNQPEAYGLQRAKQYDIPALTMPCNNKDHGQGIFSKLQEQQVNLVVLGGFLRLLWIPSQWQNRVINIHPSLIPNHCGKGYYGNRVHESVLQSKDTSSGCTVHMVDNIYDNGAILHQETVQVLPDDTVQSLADRVFAAECLALPHVVQLLATAPEKLLKNQS